MARDRKYGKRILAKGIEVSTNPYVTKLNNNVLVIGGSGSGKTGSYVVPNLQEANGSLCICDTKGLLEKHYGKLLTEKGYKIRTLDLVNPEHSWGYNPLAYIRRYPDGRIREQDVLTLAGVLSPVVNSRDPIWEMSARSYIAFLIAYCMETEKPDCQNLITVANLHREFSKPNGDVKFLSWINAHRDRFASKKYFEIMANRDADKMFASIMGFVNEALESFSYHEAKCIFGNVNNYIDIHQLGREKTILFINVSDTDRAFDKTLNIFFTQALHVLCRDADSTMTGKLKVPVHMIMDDFACGGKIPDFDKIISVIRSRDISVSLILQSLSQLETMYDHPTAITIINNCDRWVYLGSQDMDTVHQLAERALKTPENILCMPRDKVYLITNGEKAVLADKITPYS